MSVFYFNGEARINQAADSSKSESESETFGLKIDILSTYSFTTFSFFFIHTHKNMFLWLNEYWFLVYLKKQKVPMAKSLKSPEPAVRVLQKSVRQFGEYFAGKRKSFDLPQDVAGTPFQIKVWKELSKIPYGETCSYKTVAAAVKNSKAVRAVGSANGKNPLCIIVPCHRVIAHDGSLGGYSGGLDIKMRLLELERVG